jgi:hypothetical protein
MLSAKSRKYCVHFAADGSTLRVLREVVLSRIEQERKKSPFWGRDIGLFRFLNGVSPNLKPELETMTIDGWGREFLADLLMPIAQSIQAKLSDLTATPTADDLIAREKLSVMINILEQLRNPMS